jgi:alpha-glucosidase
MVSLKSRFLRQAAHYFTTANHQHYIPIVDSAIYRPNPMNETDAYATYDRGNSSNVFLHNPDGSEYM